MIHPSSLQVNVQATVSRPSRTPQSPDSDASVAPQSPFSHPLGIPQSPFSHPSVARQSPLSRPSVTPQSPSVALSHPSSTPQSPLKHPSVTPQASLCHTVVVCRPRVRKASSLCVCVETSLLKVCADIQEGLPKTKSSGSKPRETKSQPSKQQAADKKSSKKRPASTKRCSDKAIPAAQSQVEEVVSATWPQPAVSLSSGCPQNTDTVVSDAMPALQQNLQKLQLPTVAKTGFRSQKSLVEAFQLYVLRLF
jgi:hypothetical protein